MAKAWWKTRRKVSPGKSVPVEPIKASPHECILSKDLIFHLVSQPDFFQMNQGFVPIQAPVVTSLKGLAKQGIIAYAGVPSQKRKGCAGCVRRVLSSIKISLSRQFQSCVLSLEKDPERFKQAADELISYMVARKAKKADQTLVMYIQQHDRSLRKVEFPCPSSTSPTQAPATPSS